MVCDYSQGHSLRYPALGTPPVPIGMFRLVRQEIERTVDHRSWNGDLAYEIALEDVLNAVSGSSNYKDFITQQATTVKVGTEVERCACSAMLQIRMP